MIIFTIGGTMKFNIVVQHQEGDSFWIEDYDKPNIYTLDKAKAWAEQTIEWFNSTLREGEKPRKVLSVELVNENSDVHDFQKTNLVTIIKGGRNYDTLICLNCGVTAKRFGLDNTILDSKYKAAKYLKCSWKKEKT